MAKQKTIPELEAEKAENERKITQLQHKKKNSSLKTVSPTTKRESGASGRTTLSPVAQPLKVLHR